MAMFKKYPGFGDTGLTRDYQNKVIKKSSEQIILLGKIDFAKSALLAAKAFVKNKKHRQMLDFISKKLWQIMGEISLGKICDAIKSPVTNDDIKKLESWIRSFKSPQKFIDFSKKEAIFLNEARVRIRLIEPELLNYSIKRKLRKEIFAFINRASDLLFLLAYHHEIINKKPK